MSARICLVSVIGIFEHVLVMSSVKIEELKTNSKIKNIRDLYRASMTLRRGTSQDAI